MLDKITDKPRHFIQQYIDNDLAQGKNSGNVITRFPPEPNGYLHIGHAKSICLNFGLAKEYQGVCHLRFDDTNPIREEQEFVNAIEDDVRWLGFDWGKNLFFASDYFSKLYDCAVHLIKNDKAYIDSLSMEEIREYRGTLQQPGKKSPDRDRSQAENLDLFARMRAGEFPDGKYVLRAKIDMNSPNLNMRDPILYRIRHAHHQRTGNTWCIYPMYDFAHSLSDAFENITHSICTLEFQDHRPLYDWFIKHCETKSKPQQIEFSRLNLSHTVTSKRKLKYLVEEGIVSSWDDPRMPTLVGMRRRGIPASAIREFCELVGVTKSDSIINMSVFEECVRNELNKNAPRAMCVLHPLKIVIENYPEEKTENLTAPNHPQNEKMGSRVLPFSREIFIEQDDFMEVPTHKYFRLSLGACVRLRHAYVIQCEKIIKDPQSGKILELRCSYDPNTLGKNPEGRKVKGVIHWVSVPTAKKIRVRLYERLFTIENPGAIENFIDYLNKNSLKTLDDCYLEPNLNPLKPEQSFQFERLGYFCLDNKEQLKDYPVFNRIVDLRDTAGKV